MKGSGFQTVDHRVFGGPEGRVSLVRERTRQLRETLVRQQIASELHDIVTHSVSQMVIQAEGGRAVSKKRPELAVQALDDISDTGREALTEIRRVVRLLRDERTPHQ